MAASIHPFARYGHDEATPDQKRFPHVNNNARQAVLVAKNRRTRSLLRKDPCRAWNLCQLGEHCGNLLVQ
jgi:hypothetical protein